MLKRDSSRRTVPLSPAPAEMLRTRQRQALDAQLQGASSGAALVFPAQRGGLPDQTAARKAVRRQLDRAGFPWVTFHTLRRTVERQLMVARVDPRVSMSVIEHDPATSWAS
ncbi:tyrosine-type recombinase/integrase [Brachybacterium sp. J144]|uniref:tyrosine-type recombinase/integrase n=1 Tax=Brachybacterium sp. J144 TaxID=3116487 RepID=UPI003FA5799E